MRTVYKQYFRCSTQNDVIAGVFGSEIKLLITSMTYNGRRLSNGTYTTAPAWFAQVNGLPYLDTYWVMTPPSESDTSYQFSWTATNKDGTTTEYIVELVMLDYCSLETGCDTGTTSKPLTILTWLTREGGWYWLPFNGKKTFTVTIPEATTHVRSDYIRRNTERKGVYEGQLITTGDISETLLDALQSLKESIQVYYVDDAFTDDAVYYPVILQDGDFTKRKTDERRWDVAIKFIFAEERQIQTG